MTTTFVVHLCDPPSGFTRDKSSIMAGGVFDNGSDLTWCTRDDAAPVRGQIRSARIADCNCGACLQRFAEHATAEAIRLESEVQRVLAEATAARKRAYEVFAVEEEPKPRFRDLCPECGAPLKAKASGVECTKCTYWFCY